MPYLTWDTYVHILAGVEFAVLADLNLNRLLCRHNTEEMYILSLLLPTLERSTDTAKGHCPTN